MYIVPETNIRILKGVPLDTTYEHTIYFQSKEKQYNYFADKIKFNLNAYSYQRIKRGWMRVGIVADKLYDCNYVMFQNTAYGNKWFYAFIKSVEYVNNECSEIEFELDVMQTWFFDCSPDYCFVEREHSITDVIGSHIEPENVDCGEYVFNDYEAITNMYEMCVVIAVVDVASSDTGGVDGQLYDGIYGSATLWVYSATDVSGINAKIAEYKVAVNTVIAMYMLPRMFVSTSELNKHRLNYGAQAKKRYVTKARISDSDTLNGYKPINKKMYTYPYNFYHIDNASGSELSLRYEFFQNLTPVVEISGTVTQPVVAVLRPCSYKGVKNYEELAGYTTLNTESIQLNNYPLCSWNVDAWQAWVAQNAIPTALNAVSTGAGVYAMANRNATIATGATLTSAGVAGIHAVTNILSQMYTASIAADISKGNLNNGGANTANRKQQFYGGRCSVTAQYARMIDEYFSMFGYATRRVKRPNRNVRKHWTYTKTIDCTITGSVPCDDMKKICSIYNKGITFWNNGDEVGDYSLASDNVPY